MTTPNGPGAPFQLLFDDDSNETPSLPEQFLKLYPGDWHIPKIEGRPYVYTDFGISRDGRISFNEPGELAGAFHVTLADPYDRWIMALLRMRADAVMIGDNSIKLGLYETYAIDAPCPWSCEAIYPEDGDAFIAQRLADGRPRYPMQVVVSMEGDLNLDVPYFNRADYKTIIATTQRGAERLRSQGTVATVEVHELGEQAVDLPKLTQMLYSDYGVRNLLCEGGAVLFANMIEAGLIDEEFVTWCPTIVGQNAGHRRPSYTEGVAWMPGQAPYSKPFTLHRGGDFLFLRTKCIYKK